MKLNPYFKEKKAGSPHRLRLFCFPYAGGNHSIYQDWEKDLDKDISLVTVHLKGRTERMGEPAINDMKVLVDELFFNIQEFLDEPFAFFGHSLGGVLAFALLAKIEKETGKKAEKIIVSASRPVHLLGLAKKESYSDMALTKKLRDYGNTPDYVLDSQELMELILPTIRADYELLDSFKSMYQGEKIMSEAIIFNCDEDIQKEFSLKWQLGFLQECSYIDFEIGHFFIHTQRDKVINEVSRILK